MRKNILVIDDDYFIRSLLYLLLKESYDVTTAENGLEALLWLDKGNIPDAILSDVDMPEIDGFHLLEHLRKSGYYRDIPTIFLTGHNKAETLAKFKNTGVAEVFTKPFNPPELLKCLHRILQEEELTVY